MKSLLIGLVLLFLMLLPWCCCKAQVNPGYPGDAHDQASRKMHNVRDYGALGDSSATDSIAFELALAAANADSGTIYFPTGVYWIGTPPDTVGPNVTIRGDYRSSAVYMADSATMDLREGCVVKDIFMRIDDPDTEADSAANSGRLFFARTTTGGAQLECGVEHVVLHDIGVQFDNCSTGFFVNNSIIYAVDSLRGGGVYTTNECKKGSISFNRIHNCGKNGVYLLGGSENIIVCGNDIYNNGHSSILVSTNSSVPDTGFGIIIESNWLHGNPAHNGIDINPDAYSDYLNIHVKNNYIYNNNAPGIYVNGGGMTITGNRIFLNGQEGIRFSAIDYNPSDSALDTLSRHNYIQGNYLYNNAIHNDDSDFEIKLGRVAYTHVTGNYFRRDSIYAIGMDQMIYISGFGNFVTGNYFFEDSVNGARADNYDFISNVYLSGHGKGTFDSTVISNNFNQQFLNDSVYFGGQPHVIDAGYLHMTEDARIGMDTNSYVVFDSSSSLIKLYATDGLRVQVSDASNKYLLLASNNTATNPEYLFIRALPSEWLIGSGKNSGNPKAIVIGPQRTNAGDIVSNINSVYIEGGVWDSDSVGNVGIKTDNPNYELDVAGRVAISNAIMISGDSIADFAGTNLSVTDGVLNATGGGAGWNYRDSAAGNFFEVALEDKPFSTIQEAVDSADAADSMNLVLVYPGIYDESITLKDSVNIYLMAGAEIHYDAADALPVVWDDSTAVSSGIYGEGKIRRTNQTSGDAIQIMRNATTLYLEADSIIANLIGLRVDSGVVYVKADMSSGTDGVKVQQDGYVTWWGNIFNAATGYALDIFNPGGEETNGATLYGDATAAGNYAIYVNSGSTVRHYGNATTTTHFPTIGIGGTYYGYNGVYTAYDDSTGYDGGVEMTGDGASNKIYLYNCHIKTFGSTPAILGTAAASADTIWMYNCTGNSDTSGTFTMLGSYHNVGTNLLITDSIYFGGYDEDSALVTKRYVDGKHHVIGRVVAYPNAWFDDDSMCFIWGETDGAITIDTVKVWCDSNPSAQLDWRLMFANDRTTRASADTICTITTTSGTAEITSFDDATIAIGKAIYILIYTAPHVDITEVGIEIGYTYD